MSELVAPILTTDVVLLTLQDDRLCVALFKREHEPFAGVLALPGGFVRPNEDVNVAAAARRMLTQKTGLQRAGAYLEELGSFSGAARDPRGWSVSIAHYALVHGKQLDQARERGLALHPVEDLPPLPFDHGQIVAAAVARVRSKAGYSSLPAMLLDSTFSMSELHRAYQLVLGVPVNMPNLRRKIEDLGVLEEVPGVREQSGRMRPAKVFRLKKDFQERLAIRERGI